MKRELMGVQPRLTGLRETVRQYSTGNPPREKLVELPTVRHLALDYTVVCQAAKVQRLAEIRAGNCQDISVLLQDNSHSLSEFLAGDGGHLFLEMLRGISSFSTAIWVGQATVAQATRFAAWFKTDELWECSRSNSLGQRSIDRRITGFLRSQPGLAAENTQPRPWAIRPHSLLAALADYWDELSTSEQAQIQQALAGVETTHIPAPLTGVLKSCQVNTFSRSPLYKFFTNPKVLAYIVVLVYSTLRVLPVTLVNEFKGSLWVLWTLDIGTAFPYTWGAIAMISARKVSTRIIGTITTAVTFATPYVYFALTGDEYPGYVIFVVALFILSGFLLEGGKLFFERYLRRHLEQCSS